MDGTPPGMRLKSSRPVAFSSTVKGQWSVVTTSSAPPRSAAQSAGPSAAGRNGGEQTGSAPATPGRS